MQNKNCQKSPVQKPRYPSFLVNYMNMKYLSPDKSFPEFNILTSHHPGTSLTSGSVLQK